MGSTEDSAVKTPGPGIPVGRRGMEPFGSQVPGTRDGGGESGNKAECPSHASKARTRGMLCQA
jgi:hypothetical protein